MKILCPTDFSNHSKIALEYAINMANDLKAELHIVSAFQVSRKASSMVNIDDVVRKNAEEDMQTFLEGAGAVLKADIPPHTKVIQGNTVDIIVGYAKKHKMDLVVMGTQGNNSLRTLLFGSVTKKVASKSTVPVLGIPEAIAHKLTSNKIVLALDSKEINNEEPFHVLKDIATTLGLKIDIIHITEDRNLLPFDPYVGSLLGDTLGEVIIKMGDDPVLEIKKYAENHNIGLVVMIRREKSFFQRLLEAGNTSREMANTNIPLLILPD